MLTILLQKQNLTIYTVAVNQLLTGIIIKDIQQRITVKIIQHKTLFQL